MDRVIYILRAGRLTYEKGLKLQQLVIKQHQKPLSKNIIILTEHPPVYTIGIRTKGYTSADEQKLQALGAEFHRTNRGGLITFHGPGQLVAYPIINLKQFNSSVRWYVCHIEKTAIETCEKFGINAGVTSDTGVWVNDRKICAIGIHCSRYITSHGLALNCNTDLRWYEHIVPCGIEGKGVTSVSEELQRPQAIETVAPAFVESFSNQFKCHVKEMGTNETESYIRLINN